MPSPINNNLHIGTADNAAWEATLGAVKGAAKWGTLSALAGVGAYFFSPIFRGLTLQFRVYLWMCPTTIGSMVEADHRLRKYEHFVRAQQRAQIEDAREAAFLAEMKELEEWERQKKEKAAKAQS
ncbi:hypothetical protein EDC01DRAFT_646193 [Geopyxis carbonaria]|nr:hypothetical protein EDC01DRAFT_646193 [Geopyxis carbonaria]